MSGRVPNSILRLSGMVSLERLIKMSRQKLILPFYHTVSDQNLAHIGKLYHVRDVKTFKEDLDFLLKHYCPLSAEELFHHIQNGKPLDKPSFHLSFDDGLREIKEIIAPILLQKGVPSTFFVNTAFIDNRRLFHCYKVALILENIHEKEDPALLKKINHLLEHNGLLNDSLETSLLRCHYNDRELLDSIAEHVGIDFQSYLDDRKPYLNYEELHELNRLGFNIGAHSSEHPEYHKIPLDSQLAQTKESVKFVKETFQQKPSFFAFPFHDIGVSKIFFQEMDKASTNECYDLSFGTSGLKHDPIKMHLHRIPMEEKGLSAAQIIKSEYLYYLLKKPLGKNRIVRK